MEETTFEVVENEEPTVKVTQENTYTRDSLIKKRLSISSKLQAEKKLVANLEAESKTIEDALAALEETNLEAKDEA